VANFIGTPPMNFVRATVAGDGASLDTATFSVPTPAAWRAAVGGQGRRVVIGIRPEHLALGNGAAGGPGAVPATVEVVELLGSEAVFHSRAGDDVLVAKSESHRAPSVGERVTLVLDLESLHVFDAETEQRLEASPARRS
jgi:multiple sugar transport system ATP-binding protein